MNPALATLLDAAVRAPSGDNTQPWRFVVDESAGRITLALDPQRDRSPMNAGQRMARIALGAALENMLRTARNNGWAVELESHDPPVLAWNGLMESAGAIEPAIVQRVTNRRLYDGRLLPENVLGSLQQQTPEQEGVRTHWITERSRLMTWAELLGRADVMMFGEPTMRRAFLANVRFDAAINAEVAEGLSLASLELARADHIALRVLRRLPNWLIRGSGALGMFAAHARQLVESASGLCLVVAADGRQETDILVGRAVQRAWLALTAAGLAVQPMMSLLVLDNLLDHGAAEQIAALGRERLLALRQEFHQLVAEGRPAFLLRFGHAPPPTGRTGRLPWRVVTNLAGPVYCGAAEHGESS